MIDLVTNLTAAGPDVVLAEDVFTKIESLAGSAKGTVLTVFGAAFFIGAVITWAKNRFSVTSGIVALILVAVGIAILSQVDQISTLFKDTVASVEVNETPDLTAQMHGPLVIENDVMTA